MTLFRYIYCLNIFHIFAIFVYWRVDYNIFEELQHFANRKGPYFDSNRNTL